MTGNKKSKKVAREGETWQRNQNQRLNRTKMAEKRDKTVQAEREAVGDRNFERGRVKIEIESSDEMEYNYGEGFRSKNFETGQSSKGTRRKVREQRGRGRPRQPIISEEGNQT